MSSPDSPPATVFDAIKSYFLEAPAYHIALEAILVSWIAYLMFFSKNFHPASKHDKLSKKEEEELIDDWSPEPLVPDEFPKDREVDRSPVISGIAGAYVTVDGKDCINMGTFNFLGLLEHSKVKELASKTINQYGVGSCGPRGFYGTVDVHLDLETKFAAFTGREEGILYSYGFAAMSSTIPAYSKKKDIIFCDEGVSFPIQKGLVASRSKIKYFRHNDMEHLSQLLEEQLIIDRRNPAKTKVTRKFLVAEGIYYNWGDIAPLPKLVEFRNKYHIPIILEESLSFGVLGKSGKGATEHFNIPVERRFLLEQHGLVSASRALAHPLGTHHWHHNESEEVDLICVSLDTSLASVGGICAGKKYIIDHQRISGLGYCYSASVPPLMATAAIEALNIMEASSEKVSRLQSNTIILRKLLSQCSGVKVCGDQLSPVIHLRLTTPNATRLEDERQLGNVADYCMEHGLAIVTAKYLAEEVSIPPASLRLTVNSELTEEDISRAANIIVEALQYCL